MQFDFTTSQGTSAQRIWLHRAAFALALCTTIVIFLLMNGFWIESADQSPYFRLVVGGLLSVLSGLFLYQTLCNRIKTDELSDANKRLIESQSYSQAIVNTAVEAIITINASGIITTCNHAAQHMFAYPEQDMIGQNINMLMPAPHQQQHDNYLKNYLDTQQPKIIGIGREMSGVRKNGEVFPIDLSISEVYHQKDRTFVGLIRDISQQRAAEDEARMHREQLAHVARLNALGEMASGIAHEINQPLAAISLFAQAGRRLLEQENYARVPEVFDKLSQHAQRAGAIIERIQAMARQHETEKSLTQCQKLITEVAQLAESEARIHDIDIDIVVADKLPTVMVDTVQIQQVILNLLRNGMQSMRSIDCRKGNRITLQASLHDQAHIKISVIDSGGGVSAEAQNKLFEPFSSTKETGMGMGLSISRAIVEAHDGKIDFLNNDNGGATFYFTLPTAMREQ